MDAQWQDVDKLGKKIAVYLTGAHKAIYHAESMAKVRTSFHCSEGVRFDNYCGSLFIVTADNQVIRDLEGHRSREFIYFVQFDVTGLC